MDASLLTRQDRDVLKTSALCSAMHPDEIADFAARGTIKTLGRSDYLFQQGDAGHDFFLILEGWAQITRDERDGSNTLIATFQKGDTLAEAAALLGKAYPASAQAMTELRVLSMHGASLLDLMQTDRRMLAHTLASQYQKLHALVDQIEELKSNTIRERLAKFLLDLNADMETPTQVTLPFSKSLIAAQLGTSPQQLSRTFSDLRNHGVRIKGHHAQIENPAALRALVAKD
ncbi:Crp/Fnr family transcriptional regulator [Marivita sp. S0852]|uniref:Crp/Fnr family transcriptional regulator n=1 Tax=Marivita sp. S0852 TaxID=3373893 RepID=UPI0039822576